MNGTEFAEELASITSPDARARTLASIMTHWLELGVVEAPSDIIEWCRSARDILAALGADDTPAPPFDLPAAIAKVYQPGSIIAGTAAFRTSPEHRAAQLTGEI